MKFIKGKKGNYLTAKEKISEYEYANKDYFLQENADNNFVVDLFYIKGKNEIEKVTQLSRETAEKISEKELEKYLEKNGIINKKVIKDEDNDRL